MIENNQAELREKPGECPGPEEESDNERFKFGVSHIRRPNRIFSPATRGDGGVISNTTHHEVIKLTYGSSTHPERAYKWKVWTMEKKFRKK